MAFSATIVLLAWGWQGHGTGSVVKLVATVIALDLLALVGTYRFLQVVVRDWAEVPHPVPTDYLLDPALVDIGVLPVELPDGATG